MGSCSRVKGCYGDSAAKRGMVRLLERKIKVRECEKKGRRTKRRSQDEVGGRRTQLTVMAVKRSLGVTSCLPPPQSLLTWAGYDGRLTGTPHERLILTLGKSRLFTAPLLHCCCILAKKKKKVWKCQSLFIFCICDRDRPCSEVLQRV